MQFTAEAQEIANSLNRYSDLAAAIAAGIVGLKATDCNHNAVEGLHTLASDLSNELSRLSGKVNRLRRD
jgi:hypothetical protein